MADSDYMCKNSENIKLLDYLELMIITLIVFGYLGVFNSIAKYAIMVLPVITIINNRKTPIITESRILLVWAGVCVLLLLSAITSEYSFDGLMYVIILFSGLFISAFKKNITYYILLLKYFSIMAIIYGVATILNIYNPYMASDYFGFLFSSADEVQLSISEEAFSGLAGEVSYNAFCLSIGIASVTSTIINSKRERIIKGFMMLILIVLLFSGIILTQKRSFILSIPFTVTSFFILLRKKNKLKSTLIVLALFMTTLIVLGFFFPDAMGFLDRFFADNGNIYLAGRPEYWELAWTIFINNPLIGSGINSYDAVNNEVGAYFGFAGAHNSYIQYLSELGIVGFLMMLGAIIYTFYKSFKLYFDAAKKRLQLETYLLCFSLIMQMLFVLYALSGNPFHQRQQLFAYAIIVGIAVCVERRSVRHSGKVSNMNDNSTAFIRR